MVEGMSRAGIDTAIRRRADIDYLCGGPYEDKKNVRVSGRFTVESLSPHRSSSFDAAFPHGAEPTDAGQQIGAGYEATIVDSLRIAGVQNGRRRERTVFKLIDPHLLLDVRERIRDAGTSLRGNKLNRLPNWCSTCATCDVRTPCEPAPPSGS
jgi:hypothetical protein